jgi:signal transduction histidine kinase/ActR/RegA family two-component response regulator
MTLTAVPAAGTATGADTDSERDARAATTDQTRQHVRGRVARACVTIAVVGLVLTVGAFALARDVVTRLDRQRVDRPANAALLAVQQLSSSADQVLATAAGVVAATGGDPHRFVSVLGPDVTASTSLAGIALVERSGVIDRVVTSVGDTSLLAGNADASLVADRSATLVAHRHTAAAFDLGLASRLATGNRAVFLQITLPASASIGTSFALVPRSASSASSASGTDVVLGNVVTTSGLARWKDGVVLGGREYSLFVARDRGASAFAGDQLPFVTLIAGLLLTLAAALIARSVVRRNFKVGVLQTQNRALDAAVEEQRRIEAELRAAQARFETMLRDSPDAIALLHVDEGNCEILNREAFLGHPVGDLDAPGGLLRLVPPDDEGEGAAQFDRLRELRGDQILETTVRMRATDGTNRFVRLRFSRLNATDDAPPTLLGLLSDVTEEWDNQLREAELEEALRRSQRLESVGRLAGGVAHDFNNLLAAIQASAELLSGEVPAGRPEEYRQEIERAAQRGAALTRQLLTFAHRDRTEPKSVDLAEIVVGIETLLRRTISADVQLQLTTPPEACKVFADPTHLEQVIVNLALNARDAMPDGGVLWIAVRNDGDPRDAQDASSERRVVLSVTDTGTGIDPEVRDRIFDPFVTTKDPGKGTGLGLATVRTIADSVGAQIRVFSQPAQGTTFEIAFPCSGAPTTEQVSEVPDDDIDGSGVRVLLVEDEGAVRSALTQTLERRGFEVTPAPTGSEALQAVERSSFDLVLTDMVMPGMSGRALIGRLRESSPDVRIVAMSGYAPRAGDDEDADLPGTIRLVRKPFTNVQLFAALRAALAEPMPADRPVAESSA